MKFISMAAAVSALALAGCMAPDTVTRATTSAATLETGAPAAGGAGPMVLQGQYDVAEVNILVPAALRVSEANSYHPNADIVWRGEPLGDRHAQVKAIFDTAAAAATAQMSDGRKVAVDIEITYFHCLTEKARYTVGGVHSMKFLLTVRDIETGAILQGPRKVVADVKAAGGQKAIAEDEAGRTQKVVVTEHLVEVIRRELSVPVAVVPEGALVTRFDGSPVALGASQTE